MDFQKIGYNKILENFLIQKQNVVDDEVLIISDSTSIEKVETEKKTDFQAEYTKSVDRYKENLLFSATKQKTELLLASESPVDVICYENIVEQPTIPVAEIRIKLESIELTDDTLLWESVNDNTSLVTQEVKNKVQKVIESTYGSSYEVCDIKFKKGSLWIIVLIIMKDALNFITNKIVSNYLEKFWHRTKPLLIKAWKSSMNSLKEIWESVIVNSKATWNIFIKPLIKTVAVNIKKMISCIKNEVEKIRNKITKGIKELCEIILDVHKNVWRILKISFEQAHKKHNNKRNYTNENPEVITDQTKDNKVDSDWFDKVHENTKRLILRLKRKEKNDKFISFYSWIIKDKSNIMEFVEIMYDSCLEIKDKAQDKLKQAQDKVKQEQDKLKQEQDKLKQAQDKLKQAQDKVKQEIENIFFKEVDEWWELYSL